ncbi:hypothetical protein ILUMI_23791 [Ignelater luminosus]|uniref:Cuticle protein 6 n=1 Tax=Ignelater luminosus TaxID=2038154 RepID=A0A8K0CBR4_IGNLU|nr:hypothetical protein ILUMI_23791 [Ignelater luminosus]
MRVLQIEAHNMKLLILFTALWAVSGVQSSGVTIGITPYSHPVQSQYHSQDVFGQYTYGYATPTSAKNEIKTADGVTQGGYSYIDANGILQSVQYVADPIHGFRVAATNLPQDLPDVAYAKAQHLAQVEATKAEHALYAARVQYSNPIAIPAAAVQQVPLVALPEPVHDLPEVIRARAEHLAAFESVKARDLAAAHQVAISPVPAELTNPVVPVHTTAGFVATAAAPSYSYAHDTHYSYVPAISAVPAVQHVPASSQYHAQDALGQYSYGYVGPLSSKSETKTADGVVRGGYSYIDANGIVQTVHYISDPVNGFRVAATNIPVGPAEIATANVAVSAPAAPVVAATAPVVAAAPVVASAPVVAAAAPVAAAPLVATSYAQVVNTVPEAGWYKQEIFY